ncbi:hypothetical protein [Paracoccus sp. FO-3]|uniref:hypothetical protein n=1 Tax=Paracoccus sp. FO-3 TaxID=1335059 RepID=UPI001125DB7F|nr:hypothetical protein [Paracoccus sp. FO-3]
MGLPVARPGLAGTFLAVAVLFLIAGVVVNVAFLVVGGFATFGAILACFPETVSGGAEGVEMPHRSGSHHDDLALFSIDSSEERSMQPGTSEYHSRWNS